MIMAKGQEWIALFLVGSFEPSSAASCRGGLLVVAELQVVAWYPGYQLQGPPGQLGLEYWNGNWNLLESPIGGLVTVGKP